jgi:hypothetical protein
MPDEPPRSRAARHAAERALVRVVHHYGSRPEFVVLGGLVPELLCASSGYQHAGTTDIDVQVDLEIACGAVNATRLEQALRSAGFEPDSKRLWRWQADDPDDHALIKFELLADRSDRPAGAEIRFRDCEALGAANLRGTGFASRDIEVRRIGADIDGIDHHIEVNVTGLAGFLLAKCGAARERQAAKDWYDIAFVLHHNDAGGIGGAADLVRARFGDELATVRTALDDLRANFSDRNGLGAQAYADQMVRDHPELDYTTLLADGILAIDEFHNRLYSR